MQSKSSAVVLCLAILPSTGCSGCGDTAGDKGVAADVPVAVAEQLMAPFAGRTASATAPAKGVAYTVPAECVLRYAFEVRVESDPPPKPKFDVPQASSARLGGTFALAARPGGVQITPGKWTMAHSADGSAELEWVASEGQAAPVHLVLEDAGRRWVEVNGPTVSWATQRAFAGLAVFFPTVPAGVAVGETVDWRMELVDDKATAATEAARGKPKPSHDIGDPLEPERCDAISRVAGWVTVDGKLAVRLQTRWTQDDTHEGMVHAKVASRFGGESLVLVSGALLAGTAQEVVSVSRRLSDGQEQDFKQMLTYTVRLVEGCGDMPVAPPLAPVHAPRRGLLDAWAQVIRGLADDDAEGTLAPLSDELRRAHGDQLLSTLRRHTKHFKMDVLGQKLDTDDVVLQGTHVTGTVAGETYLIYEHMGTDWPVPTRLEGRVGADGAVTLTFVGSDDHREYEKPRLLEISAKRVFSAAPK